MFRGDQAEALEQMPTSFPLPACGERVRVRGGSGCGASGCPSPLPSPREGRGEGGTREAGGSAVLQAVGEQPDGLAVDDGAVPLAHRLEVGRALAVGLARTPTGRLE